MIINKITQAMQGELRKVDGSRKIDRDAAVGATPKAADRPEISAGGKVRAESAGDVQMIASVVRAAPEVRQDKIELAQSRLASGFYNTEEFAGKLAERLAAVV